LACKDKNVISALYCPLIEHAGFLVSYKRVTAMDRDGITRIKQQCITCIFVRLLFANRTAIPMERCCMSITVKIELLHHIRGREAVEGFPSFLSHFIKVDRLFNAKRLVFQPVIKPADMQFGWILYLINADPCGTVFKKEFSGSSGHF